MQQWEYLFVNCHMGRSTFCPRFVNEQELKDWKNGPSIPTYLNQLGSEGWELVAERAWKGGFSFILKRPKS